MLAAALDTATLPYRLQSGTAPPDLGPATGAFRHNPPRLATGMTMSDVREFAASRLLRPPCWLQKRSRVNASRWCSHASTQDRHKASNLSGATSMWDMAALLTPAGRANLAAAGAALPAPPLPADTHAAAASSDARTGVHAAAVAPMIYQT